jgi:hypothetical protein
VWPRVVNEREREREERVRTKKEMGEERVNRRIL